MGIGVSIFLFAVGAILAFAVEMDVSGLDINTVGVILMLVGGIGIDHVDDLLEQLGRLRNLRRPHHHQGLRRPSAVDRRYRF